jgi:Protein of unknown function (DUF3349)
MPLPQLLQAIVDFVRKGYPQGVPQHDYVPLLALLRRRLTDEEVVRLARDLRPDSPDPDAAIEAALRNLTDQPSSEQDVERVRARLRQAGWDPLDQQ